LFSADLQEVPGAGTVELRLKLTGKTRKRLAREGTIKLKTVFGVGFTPLGGEEITGSASVVVRG
jgi:hypothetical protein